MFASCNFWHLIFNSPVSFDALAQYIYNFKCEKATMVHFFTEKLGGASPSIPRVVSGNRYSSQEKQKGTDGGRDEAIRAWHWANRKIQEN